MALRITKVPYRRWPVTVALRSCDDAGEVTESDHRFVAHFTAFDEAGIDKARREVFGDGDDAALRLEAEKRTSPEQAALEAKYFCRLVCGWEAVTDDDGQPVTFSTEMLTALLTGEDGPAFRRAFNVAIVQLRMGVAPAKNVVTSPAPGPMQEAGEAATS